MISGYFSSIIDWYMANINYFTVTLLMTIESSFIPFPSEVIIPPAAWKAAQGELNVYLVLAAGIAGSLLGAVFNYYFALYLGRKLVYSLAETKIAHLMLINREAVEKSERYFLKYGNSSTFIGRLVPAVRQLISLPAGLSKMDLKAFLLYTTLGSGIWNAILAALGYYLYTQKETLSRYFEEISWALLCLGILFLVYLIVKTKKGKRTSTSERRGAS
jgi:membrane protein DedA with SNARE-associated domain